MLTEIEVEGVGTMRHLNDWQLVRIKRIADPQNRAIAVIAFGLGMTVHQFKQLSPVQQKAAREAEAVLTAPHILRPQNAPVRIRLPRKGEHIPLQKRVELGEELLSIKRGMPHGHFGIWLVEKSGIGIRQAQRCMKAAKAASHGSLVAKEESAG
jgi:hypothetical protein